MKDYIDYLVDWLKTQVSDAHAKGVIVGLSGGIDSAVVAALCHRAFPDQMLGVVMPCHSISQDAQDAHLLIETLGLHAIEIDLSATYDALKSSLDAYLDQGHGTTLALGNTKARLRMSTLYALGQSHGYLVVGTDNAAEWHTGYFTKYGDGGVDLVPLIHLLKREVKEMARLLGVPSVIIDKDPAAGLFSTQTDGQELGVTYLELDDYLSGYPVSDKSVAIIERLHERSMHKRSLAAKPLPIKR